MPIEVRRQVAKTIAMRYKNATKKQKKIILDEFCATCGYSRKHAIRLILRWVHILASGRRPRANKSGRIPLYGSTVQHFTVVLWKKMRRMCSKRMKEALPVWLGYFNEPGCTEEVKRKMLMMSPATIDRILKPHRAEWRRGLSATRPGAFIKSQIPIELLDSKVRSPGHIEADTVAHCGSSLLGEFTNSLTLTDLLSGWTENKALWTKRSDEVIYNIKEIRSRLPFRIMSFASDNGSEFLNRPLVDYFSDIRQGRVKFIRRRPYKKNDAAHVEQKNDAMVRKLFGYSRLDHPDFCKIMNEIYVNYWNPLNNYFFPVMKLKKKIRIGAKMKKIYDTPKTPFARLMDSPYLTKLQKERLEMNYLNLNPFTLRQGLDQKLSYFNKLLAKYKNLVHGGDIPKVS